MRNEIYAESFFWPDSPVGMANFIVSLIRWYNTVMLTLKELCLDFKTGRFLAISIVVKSTRFQPGLARFSDRPGDISGEPLARIFLKIAPLVKTGGGAEFTHLLVKVKCNFEKCLSK